MAFIGAGLVAVGTLLLGFMWLSKGSASTSSTRDSTYTRDRIDRMDAEPLRRT